MKNKKEMGPAVKGLLFILAGIGYGLIPEPIPIIDDIIVNAITIKKAIDAFKMVKGTVDVAKSISQEIQTIQQEPIAEIVTEQNQVPVIATQEDIKKQRMRIDAF